MRFRFQTLSGIRQMPFFRTFPLFLLVAVMYDPGQAQDSAADDPAQPASHDMPVPAPEEPSVEPPVSAEEESLAPSAEALNLYSPGVLVDMPYVYPLLRMRLTSEMRQGTP